MGVLALLAFLANTCLEVGTQSVFVIDLTVLSVLHLSDLFEQRLQEVSFGFFGSLCFLLRPILLFDSFRSALHAKGQKSRDFQCNVSEG